MEKVIFWGIIDIIALIAISTTVVRMAFRWALRGQTVVIDNYQPNKDIISSPPQGGSGVPDRPLAPDPEPKNSYYKPADICNHDHAKWRLDLTKDITEFKKQRKGPSDYSYYRDAFIRAFEFNDVPDMNDANDKMKSIELTAGVINDVDIIERLMQIKKVKTGKLFKKA